MRSRITIRGTTVKLAALVDIVAQQGGCRSRQGPACPADPQGARRPSAAASARRPAAGAADRVGPRSAEAVEADIGPGPLTPGPKSRRQPRGPSTETSTAPASGAPRGLHQPRRPVEGAALDIRRRRGVELRQAHRRQRSGRMRGCRASSTAPSALLPGAAAGRRPAGWSTHSQGVRRPLDRRRVLIAASRRCS